MSWGERAVLTLLRAAALEAAHAGRMTRVSAAEFGRQLVLYQLDEVVKQLRKDGYSRC